MLPTNYPLLRAWPTTLTNSNQIWYQLFNTSYFVIRPVAAGKRLKLGNVCSRPYLPMCIEDRSLNLVEPFALLPAVLLTYVLLITEAQQEICHRPLALEVAILPVRREDLATYPATVACKTSHLTGGELKSTFSLVCKRPKTP